MKNFLSNIKDAIAVISAMLFHVSNKRFDSIAGSQGDTYTDIIGKTAIVTETVSSSSGMVKYSGAHWQARLSEHSTVDSVTNGSRVTIESINGNTLIVRQTA